MMKITKRQLRKIIKEQMQRGRSRLSHEDMAQRLRDFQQSGYSPEEAADEVYEERGYDVIDFLRNIAKETKNTDPKFSSYAYEVAYQAGEIHSYGSTMFDEPDRDGGSRYRRYMGY